MAEVNDMQILAANNTARWPEGMQINNINDSARELEAMIARWSKDIQGANTSTGTGTAYAVTPYRTIAALAAGICMVWKAHVACSGACTLSVGGIAAKPLRRMDGSVIELGDIELNQMVCSIYDASNDWWQCLGLQRMVAPTYTVAGLPTSGPNMAIASNGRRNGQGAGAGTGVLCFRLGTTWYACDTGVAVAA